jgi:hypothetical protein
MPKKFNWLPSMVEMLIQRFPKEGTLALSREIGLSRGSIMKKALELGLESPTGIRDLLFKNRETLKVDYFKKWSSVMAYDLGYIWADGSVSDPQEQGILTLRCKSEDEEIVLGVRTRLGSNHTINRRLGMTRVHITSKPLVESLINDCGVLPCKSELDLHFPCVPSIYLSEFCRGYFDGDGCVHQSKRGELRVLFLGSHRFIKDLHLLLCLTLGLTFNKPYLKEGSPTISVAEWSAQKDVEKLRDWLYPQGVFPALNRKKQIMLEEKQYQLPS